MGSRPLSASSTDNENEFRQISEDEIRFFRYESSSRQLLCGFPSGVINAEHLYMNTGVRFSGNRLFLAQLEDNPKHPSFPPENTSSTSPIQRYTKLRNCILSVINRHHPAVLCNQGGSLICVINWQWNDSNWHGKFSDIAAEVNHALFSQFGFTFQFTVSRMCSGLEQIQESRKELDLASNYRKLLGGLPGEIVFYDGILKTSGLENRISPIEQKERQQQFVNYIIQGNCTMALEIFHSVIDDHFSRSRPAVQFVQLRFFEVIDFILRSMEQAAYDLECQNMLYRLQAAPRLLNSKNVDELKQTADEILNEFFIILEESSIRAGLPNRIRSYILENFRDPELNVSKIAEIFGITTTYATRIFRQQFQCGILNYIQQIRVNEVKTLLCSTRNMNEISALAGFPTATAMLRTFKKLEGTTPAQFMRSKVCQN